MFCFRIVLLPFVLALALVQGFDTNTNELVIPVIDLTPWLEASNDRTKDEHLHSIVHQVRKACQTYGFFQITGRNLVDPTILQTAYQASQEFFGRPLEEKLLYQSSSPSYPYGYERSETLARGRLLEANGGEDCSDDACAIETDTKETFSLGPQMPPRKWIPNDLNRTDFSSSLETYYQSMEDLAHKLLQIVAMALDESPNFFENKMDHHMSALRLVHYYPLSKEGVRAGAHTDYGALTILAAQTKGLQIFFDKTWHFVPVIPGAWVINLGDLMQRWTNGKWVSTMHRVVLPATSERHSIAYFVNVNGDTKIEALQCCGTLDENAVITAGEHLMAKHLASMGIGSSSSSSSFVEDRFATDSGHPKEL